MVSSKKLAANRLNARASTGPRTRAGKASSSKNALRHGLTLPLQVDGTLAAEIEELARAMVDAEAPPLLQYNARVFALAQFDVVRIRRERARLWEKFQVGYSKLKTVWRSEDKQVVILVRLIRKLRPILRYEQRAVARRNAAARALDQANTVLKP
jgi:hypothetical protein